MSRPRIAAPRLAAHRFRRPPRRAGGTASAARGQRLPAEAGGDSGGAKMPFKLPLLSINSPEARPFYLTLTMTLPFARPFST